MCVAHLTWMETFNDRWDMIAETRERMNALERVDIKNLPEGSECTFCKRAFTDKDNQVVLKRSESECKKDSHVFVHWDCCECEWNESVVEYEEGHYFDDLEEFKNLKYFNFRKELQIHMNAIEKVDAKTLPEGKECGGCEKKFSEMKNPVVLKPWDCNLDDEHSYFEWDCLEDLFTRGYLRDCCMNGRCCFPFKDVLFDYDEDFQKFKEYAVKNDEVIEKVVPKLSSHL